MRESDVVIRVEGLGKKYSLHHEQGERYTALRDVVGRQAKEASRLLNPFTMAGQLRKAQRQAAQEHAASEEEFWALKDVSFEIRRGERVGIIGRNGAGKSTLLKILSRITEPTTGRVEIRGRVASLLEVGTGFHPELTGRENIYLNGAILGMTRREIRSKFDEIVDFAEVEKFLDTPVKRYSSGMYVRLAFAVAAHLEPEILVVDEVLAVGDSSYQRKCISKIQDVSENGRTVLFVSHSLNLIEQLTNKAIALNQGCIIYSGITAEAISKYMTLIMGASTGEHSDWSSKRKSNSARQIGFTKLRFPQGIISHKPNEDIVFQASIESSVNADSLSFSLTIHTLSGKPVGSTFSEGNAIIFAGEEKTFSVSIVNPCLAPGSYSLSIAVGTGNNKTGYSNYDVVREVLHFSILNELGEDGSPVFWSPAWGDIVLNPLVLKQLCI